MSTVSALGAWIRAGLVVLVVLVLDQVSKHLVRQLDRPRRRTQGAAGDPARQHPQPRRRLRLSPRRSDRRHARDRGRVARAARLLRAARHAPADLAADRHARRRCARQRPRPAARRVGNRLRQAPARLASVQPRRHLDHARRAAPAVRARDPAQGHARDRLTALHNRLPGRRTCSSSTKPPAWSCTPRAGIARARSRSCSHRSPPAGKRGAPGSCTGSTATPPGCSSSRARTRLTGCCRRRSPSGASSASTSRSSRDARRRARDDRGADRARPANPHAHDRRRL